MTKRIITLLTLAIFLACSGNNQDKLTYNGRAETDIIRLSAQSGGNIDTLTVKEGDTVQKGQLLAVINSDRVHAQLRQQKAQMDELNLNLSTLRAQIRQVEAQLKLSLETYEKTKVMFSEGAATEHKRDELATQVDVQKAQLDALRSGFQAMASKKEQLTAAMDLTRITLKDCRIFSPLDGIVINKFYAADELAVSGRVLLEVADLSMMEVTIYVPPEDLHRVKIGEQAVVHIDGMQETMAATVKWVSTESEFTPKTILTKETRTTLVYAVKLSVANPDGTLKIGMPVDVEF